jgi:O-antigen ligase
MTNEQIIYTVAIGSGVVGILAYIAFILVPAWGAYSRIWQRFAASFLTLYVLAAFIIAGAAGGAAIVYFWDRLGS